MRPISGNKKNGCLERVEIVGLRHDEMGILHVHYRYGMEQQGRQMFSDMRTLAAQAFYARFGTLQRDGAVHA